MTLTSGSAWALAAASSFGAAMIIYSPLMYWATDSIAGKKGYISSEKGTRPTLLGLFLHTTVLFFVLFGLMNISWACQ